MLPRPHRLHRSVDFDTVVRKGARKGRRTMVVHVHVDAALSRVGGPRFGLIVSKAVGDAVTRHRISRRLRHIAAELLSDIDPEMKIVIRAHRAAADASYRDLLEDMRSGLESATDRARRSLT